MRRVICRTLAFTVLAAVIGLWQAHQPLGMETWLGDVFGMSYRPVWKTSQGAVGYERDSVMLSKTALMDTSHPLYEHMRWLRYAHSAGQVLSADDFKMGQAFGSWMRGVQFDETHAFALNAHDDVEWREQPLFTQLDADTRLAAPHMAVANIWRAGVPSRDIIRLPEMYEFPPELLTAPVPETKVG